MTTYLTMQRATRAQWRKSRYRRVPWLVFLTGLSLTAVAAIMLYDEGVITPDRIRSGDIPRMTMIELGGALVLTIFLTAMVRSLAIASARAASGEAEAREKLSMQTRRFQTLERDGWDGVMIVDSMAVIRWMGVTAARLLRLDPDEVAGASLLGLVHFSDMDAFLGALAVPNDSPSRRFEFRIRGPQGKDRWLEGVASNHTDNDAVSGVVLHFRDMTDRRSVVDALRDRDGHARAAFDDSPFGAANVGLDGELLSVNGVLAEIVERDADALTGKKVGTLLSSQDRNAVRSAMRKIGRGELDRLVRGVYLATGKVAVLGVTPVMNDDAEVRSLLMQIVELPRYEVEDEPTDQIEVMENEDFDTVSAIEETDEQSEETWHKELAELAEAQAESWFDAPVDLEIDRTNEDLDEEPTVHVAVTPNPDNEEPTELLRSIVTRDIAPNKVLRRIVSARLAEHKARDEKSEDAPETEARALHI